jgi:spermidine synthase
MGFTLRAALASLGPDAHVAVAELVPKVIEWAKGPLTGVFKGCLEDPRVALHEADVNRLIQQRQGAWDAILLDVDNGPEGLTRRENDRLYDSWGVKRALWALSPDGVLGVWSGGPDRKFKARLQNGGFTVDEVRPRSGGRRGARHVVWLASRATSPAAGSAPVRRRRDP